MTASRTFPENFSPVFSPAVQPPARGDVHVTRHFSLTGETNAEKSPNFPLSVSEHKSPNFGPSLADQKKQLAARREALGIKQAAIDADPAPRFAHADQEQNLDQSISFCDWVSMYQDHGGDLPRLSDGCFVRFDADGVHESTTLKKLKVEGSHETSLFVRCDGSTVWFEGNISKFGRPDNVFGYSFAQCLERINAFLSAHQLPPFTKGVRGEYQAPGGKMRPIWTGARITRLDLTVNYSSGSKENGYHFMRFLASQQASRLKTGTHGEGETVDFGRHSRRVYSKAYLKGPELLKHAKRNEKKTTAEKNSLQFDSYLNQLADWCNEIGLVRFETTYHSTFLIDNYFQFLGGIDMTILESDFTQRQSVFTRANAEVDSLASLEPKILAVYRMWQAGDDIVSSMSRATFYRYRSLLLPHGIDIAIKSNVIKFEPKTRVIQLVPVTMPDFYKLPAHSQLRLVA